MLLKEIVQLNFVTLVAVAFSLISFIKNKSMERRIRIIYIVTTIIIAILMIAGSLDYYFESLTKLNKLRYLTSIIGYSLRPVGLLLVIYTLLRFNNSRKISWLICVPAIINISLYLLNFGTKWMFSIDVNNNFIHGPLGFFPFVVSGIYLAVLTYVAIMNYRFVEKIEILLVIVTSIAIVMSVVLESVFSFRCLVNGVGILSANYYYLYLNMITHNRDDLTNLLNRRSFYSEVNSISGKWYVVCLDINNLKEINDNYGHLEGDKAIKIIARIIVDNTSKNDKIYRVGGDEFVVLSKVSEEELLNNFRIITKKIEEQNLSIAYGYELFDPSKEFDKIYSSADKKMYECKARMKQAKSSNI